MAFMHLAGIRQMTDMTVAYSIWDSSATDDKSRFPNIVYLGMGYNILKGNPQPLDVRDNPDPGFYRVASVVDMSDFSGVSRSEWSWVRPCHHACPLAPIG